jgi:hypothetical protein
VVLIDGKVLGVPRDTRDAVRVLLELQGREHMVATGVAVAADDNVRSAIEHGTLSLAWRRRSPSTCVAATCRPPTTWMVTPASGAPHARARLVHRDTPAHCAFPLADCTRRNSYGRKRLNIHDTSGQAQGKDVPCVDWYA